MRAELPAWRNYVKNSIEQSEAKEESGTDPWSGFYKEIVDEEDALTLYLIRTLLPDILNEKE
jgi:hypothetical protein